MVVTLSNFVKRHHDPVTREPLGPRQDALLAILFQVVHHQPAGSVRVKFLAETTNALLQCSGERLALTDKATGTILSTLGFKNKCRTNQGWILWLDSDTQKRAPQLLRPHGVACVSNREPPRALQRDVRRVRPSSVPMVRQKLQVPLGWWDQTVMKNDNSDGTRSRSFDADLALG